jgi:hypothetical protein
MASAYFTATNNTNGGQLYKLGSDDSVTLWTANPGTGSGLNPEDPTEFNNAAWFEGETSANGYQLFKLGSDSSVTQWTAIGTNLNPSDLTVFNNELWFNGADITSLRQVGQSQLYKLGSDGSVTRWTADLGSGGSGLHPYAMTVFNNALWFEGEAPANGYQLFKLGSDGSVTQWTAIGTNLNPAPLSWGAGPSAPSVLDNALWFQANNLTLGTELYKLGADGSFTFWKDINPGLPSSTPNGWAPFG